MNQYTKAHDDTFFFWLNSLNFIDLAVFKKVKGRPSRSMYDIQILQNEYEEIQISHAQKID